MRTDPKPLKETEKSAVTIEVECKMTDCIYHEGSPSAHHDHCFCSHPHKYHYLAESKCPLYQYDFLKRMKTGRPQK